jgi:4-coumarate--CoA ligase
MHVFATPIVPASIRGGHPTYIMRRFDMQHFIEAIEKFEISETWMPPPVLIGIPQSPLATKSGLRSLRSIWMGGAGVTYANQLPLYELLDPEAKINQVWGMTECGWVTTTVWPEKQTDDTVGRALSGFELR